MATYSKAIERKTAEQRSILRRIISDTIKANYDTLAPSQRTDFAREDVAVCIMKAMEKAGWDLSQPKTIYYPFEKLPMKTSLALIALALCAALPVRAGDTQVLANPNELNTRNCVRAMSTRFTEAEFNAPDYREKSQFKDQCFDTLVAERNHRQEHELINRSPDATLLNCVRIFFSIAADGTEYQLRPAYQNCSHSPDCTARVTLLGTDGIQTAQEKPMAA